MVPQPKFPAVAAASETPIVVRVNPRFTLHPSSSNENSPARHLVRAADANGNCVAAGGADFDHGVAVRLALQHRVQESGSLQRDGVRRSGKSKSPANVELNKFAVILSSNVLNLECCFALTFLLCFLKFPFKFTPPCMIPEYLT